MYFSNSFATQEALYLRNYCHRWRSVSSSWIKFTICQSPASKINFCWLLVILDLFFLYTCVPSLLQCPVLIAWGDKDPWEPIELGRAYGNFDSVEDFIVLPNVGHCPQVSLYLSLSSACLHTHSYLHTCRCYDQVAIFFPLWTRNYVVGIWMYGKYIHFLCMYEHLWALAILLIHLGDYSSKFAIFLRLWMVQ